jgi:hypothetical protein
MSHDTLLNVVQVKLDRLPGSPSIAACAIGLGVVYVVYSVFWIKRYVRDLYILGKHCTEV